MTLDVFKMRVKRLNIEKKSTYKVRPKKKNGCIEGQVINKQDIYTI